MGAVMWRLAKSLFVHIAVLVLALLLIYLVARGQESLSAEVLTRYQGRSPAALLTVLADARGEIVTWAAIGIAISWIASAIFLAVAERTTAANEREARRLIGLWAGMLIVTVALLAANSWLRLFSAGITGDLAASTFIACVLIGGLAVLIAYWLSTGLVVKRVMRPSVPLAAALPSFWS